jgi:hypothetical protein
MGAKAGAPGHGENDDGVGVKGGGAEKRGSLVEREQIDGLVSDLLSLCRFQRMCLNWKICIFDTHISSIC